MTVSETADSMRAGLDMLLAAVHADDPKREILVRVGDLMRDVKSLTAALSEQVVVPKEPTKEMLLAGTIDLGYDDDYNPMYLSKDDAKEVWRAMLAAAPPPVSPAG